MANAHIVGWGHTKFGRLENKSLEDLIIEAAEKAMDHAGVQASDIDAVFLGHFNSGMVGDGFPPSLVLNLDDGLRFKPATRLENACASGSAAVYSGRNTIAAVFARFAQAYFQAYGDQSLSLARIAAKNHANAMHNPLAQLQKPLSVEFCNSVSDKNPMIVPPLRMSDCSRISDGAAAMVMVSDELSDGFENAIAVRSAVQVNDFLPMSRRDLLAFEGPAKAFHDAFEAAGIEVGDLDFTEVHDCFTIAELLVYEAMRLAPKGQGRKAIEEGIVLADGSLPVNLSGGLKAKGHPVGATGVSMHVMAARQLTNQAGEMQKQGASLGCVFNMGGSGVANYCSILEPVRSAS